ncbi:LysM peptidoglycan-binding domain-containing protein [Vibrio sp. T187]|uniref:LysM peptidoglycan-binding domain-containing protein n=1 Tax=Vibrio TaxID=662 RepID=UPI0010C95CE4|nr:MULTISPECIES: LysM peptidoglycan-binding domain-containing protein [Vibrio]MBW3698419.1 LysM peptidoglycan-binding domain-containing protein [Vibrio sp. T187]
MRQLFRTFSLLCLPFSLSVTAEQSASTAPVNDQPLSIKQNAPQTYIVVKGDTLWDIAAMYLDSAWLWPRLWQVNPDIDNPHLIYPGDKLSLVWRNGQPVLSLKPVIKLSPKIRISEKKAVPTVDEGLVLPYLNSDRLIDEDTLNAAARVLGTNEGRKFLTHADRVFISGIWEHKKWGIYRRVETYSREKPSANITSLRLVATARLTETKDQFSGLQVDSQLQEILLNDVALPEVSNEGSELSTTFYPIPSPLGESATILGSIEGSQYSAKNQVVIIDKGAFDDLRQGSMFELLESGATVYGTQGNYSYESSSSGEEYQLPDTPAGSLMIIRPYEYFSLALVTNSLKPINSKVLAISPLAVNLGTAIPELP